MYINPEIQANLKLLEHEEGNYEFQFEGVTQGFAASGVFKELIFFYFAGFSNKNNKLMEISREGLLEYSV